MSKHLILECKIWLYEINKGQINGVDYVLWSGYKFSFLLKSALYIELIFNFAHNIKTIIARYGCNSRKRR